MEKLLVICGSTGSGKTDLALQLAKKFDGEIVSADSRQVYTGMDIGTGKELESPRTKIKKEKGAWIVNSIPIYLYDIITPDQRFSLAEYQQLALEKIREIQSRKKLPILVGGTGLYIQAVTEGLKIPKAPPDFNLREKLDDQSLDELLLQLKKIDPATFERIDKNNKRRVIRALEVYHQTGETFSSLQQKYSVNFDIFKIGLTTDREELYAKNDKRVENWFNKGFEEEVRQLLKKYDLHLPALTSLGYRQVAMYINKEIELPEAMQRIKFEVHGYIRRQQTWFKRDRTINWFDLTLTNLESEVESFVDDWLKTPSESTN